MPKGTLSNFHFLRFSHIFHLLSRLLLISHRIYISGCMRSSRGLFFLLFSCLSCFRFLFPSPCLASCLPLLYPSPPPPHLFHQRLLRKKFFLLYLVSFPSLSLAFSKLTNIPLLLRTPCCFCQKTTTTLVRGRGVRRGKKRKFFRA